MYTHHSKIRVRYAETDQMGFVYYGNYPAYFEVARVEAFRALNYPYKEMEEAGVGMPVLDLKIQYHKPGKYDDLLTLKVTIPEAPRARIRFAYEISNEEGKLLVTGETTLAFMQMGTGRPVKMPQKLSDVLLPYF